MLDPVGALAFEMHAGKGVFAVLLGSGISRTAKIPTGWDITLDLVRQIAALRNEDAGTDPAAWYTAATGKAPDYSALLDQLATTPTLRQKLIHPYIEPSADERARGEKLPTAAHRAIAQLMASGYIRVALTTNFDQLLEQALAEAGARPTVIASADQAVGALPLVHAGLTIVKLHGDYLDTRIRNTAGELATYEPALDKLLDEVLDQFGLIVCGWSAEWDTALKAALERAPSRRFPTVWAARGAPAAAAQSLIQHRGARLAPIDGADHFFDALAEKVKAIETLRQPHPLSADLAVAMLKEYILDPRHAIRLHDLLNGELGRAAARISELKLDTHTWSLEIFAKHVTLYQSAIAPILPVAFAAGRWGSVEQAGPWVEFISSIVRRRREGTGGSARLVDLRGLPATLTMYAFGLGAVIGKRLVSIGRIVGTVEDFSFGHLALGDGLNVSTVITDGGGDAFKALPEYQNKQLPQSEFIADVLRPLVKSEFRDDEPFDAALARLELALALGYVERVGDGGGWVPPGRFALRHKRRDALIAEWDADHKARGLGCDACVIAALRKAPEFAHAKTFYGERVRFL